MSVRAIPAITEKGFQAQVEQLARLCGWTVFHPWLSIRSAHGFPDLTCCRPPRVLFVELKREGGKLSEQQRRWLELLGQCPAVESYCWRPSDWPSIERTLR